MPLVRGELARPGSQPVQKDLTSVLLTGARKLLTAAEWEEEWAWCFQPRLAGAQFACRRMARTVTLAGASRRPVLRRATARGFVSC